MVNLEKQKLKLESSKERLKEKERVLKEKERVSTQALVTNLGQLFLKTKLLHLDDEVLLGALLEIAEKARDETMLAQWRTRSQQHNDTKKSGRFENEGARVTISFKSQPKLTTEIKQNLKEMKFKWNEFRGEYYGFGDRESLQNLLRNYDCTIETIETVG